MAQLATSSATRSRSTGTSSWWVLRPRARLAAFGAARRTCSQAPRDRVGPAGRHQGEQRRGERPVSGRPSRLRATPWRSVRPMRTVARRVLTARRTTTAATRPAPHTSSTPTARCGRSRRTSSQRASPRRAGSVCAVLLLDSGASFFVAPRGRVWPTPTRETAPSGRMSGACTRDLADDAVARWLGRVGRG